jgi:hypothetical protein
MSVSASTIQRAYAKGGVRFKFINRIKKEIDLTTEYYGGLFASMY